ncbi:MAG: hypothetical protein IPM48_13225 [Saprospiraceae bacterium]|nr:hypothetical protein [Saprospiraceae bacterium]
MVQEVFSYLYPMPDDVAQSMLISETETNIHIRPTTSNAYKTWMHNKLLRNLITKRKTLVLVNNLNQLNDIQEFMDIFNLSPLFLRFHHSRSEIEKELAGFKPVSVSGSLNINTFKRTTIEFVDHANLLLRSISQCYYPEGTNKDSLLLLLNKYIRLPKENFHFLVNFPSKLSSEEIYFLKRNIDDLSANALGQLRENHPLKNLNQVNFELFLVDEAWSYFSHFLQNWYARGKVLLSEFKMIQTELADQVYGRLRKIKTQLIAGWELQNLSTENPVNNTIEKQLAVENLISFLIDLGKERIISSNSMAYSKLEWEVELEKAIEDTLPFEFERMIDFHETPSVFLKCVNTLKEQFEVWYKDLENSKILIHVPEYKVSNFSSQISLAQRLMGLVYDILEQNVEFEKYFEWERLTYTFSPSQKELLLWFKAIPPDQWSDALEYFYINQQFEGAKNSPSITGDDQIANCIDSLLVWKSKIQKYLHSVYEKEQYLNLIEMEKQCKELHSSIGNNMGHHFSLSDYYQRLDSLAMVFPVIILESLHPEFYPADFDKIWDEVWNLNDQLQNEYLPRFLKSCHHFINLFEGYSDTSSFQIALSQSPPLIIKSVLIRDFGSDSFEVLHSFASFIYNNFPQFKIFVNSSEHCISFLPKHIESLILQWSDSDWNQITLDDSSALDQLTEIFLFKGTLKKIWIVDGLFNPQVGSIQQLEWQWHFRRCMEAAGFEIIDFSTSLLFEYRNFLKLPAQGSFIQSKRTVLSRG